MKTILNYSMLLLLGIATTGRADTLQSNLTLQAALDYGANNNPMLQAAFNQWKGLEENISVRKALPDPMVTYGYYFESVETRVGPQNQRFGISQTFPGFGKLASQRDIATDEARAAEQRYRQEKLNLNFNITKAYAELYYLKRSIDITQDRIQLILDFEEVARTRYKAGSPMAPILQAQVELGRLEDQLSSLHDQREPQVARLNATLNRPTNAPLSWPDNLPYAAVDIDETEWLENMGRSSPELTALTHNVMQAESRIILAKRSRLPDFTLGIQYIDTDNASAPVTDSGKDPIIGTVGLTIPLWLGKNSSQIQSAVYMKTAAQLTLESREQTLAADMKQTLFKLRDADRKMTLYRDSLIPKALQSLEVNRKGYEAGKMEFINLIDAERMLLEFELAYERARVDHLIRRAELSRLTGIDVLEGENHETH
jgi:outer membrane protein TolC